MTPYKSKQVGAAVTLYKVFWVAFCDWDESLPLPHEVFFEVYRICSEHFKLKCQAKGVGASKMVVFKNILADPTVILRCISEMIKQFQDLYQTVNLQSSRFESLALRVLNRADCVLPVWLRQMPDLHIGLVSWFKFFGMVMICDLYFLHKYFKNFIRANKGEKYATFMHFVEITKYACQNGVSYAQAVATPGVTMAYQEYIGSSNDPATLFACLSDGIVNDQLIKRFKAIQAEHKLKLHSHGALNSDDDVSSSASQDDPLLASMASTSKDKKESKKKGKSQKKVARNRRNGKQSRIKARLYAQMDSHNGGLKDQYRKVADKECCKIYLYDGQCMYASSGLCGPGTKFHHKCVCKGKNHKLLDCNRNIWKNKQ